MKHIWIAFAHVNKRKGFENILRGYGAYVNIIVQAEDIKQLKKIIEEIFFEEGFILIELNNIELLSSRLKNFDVDQSILDLVNNLSDKYPVQFGPFDSYPEEDCLEKND